MKRTRMERFSEKRRIENTERREVMKLIRARDVGCIARGQLPHDCFGPLNGHEIITRAQGGSITDPRNIVLCCDFHNTWVDLNHDEAVALGFRVSRTDPYSPKFPARLPIAPATPPAGRTSGQVLSEPAFNAAASGASKIAPDALAGDLLEGAS